MATKRLGKGLEALIGVSPPNEIKSKGGSSKGVATVLISKIKTNPYQPRKEFNKDSLKDLASSIKQKGVISPIVAAVSDKRDKASIE